MFKKIFGKIFKSAEERAAEDEEYFKRTSIKNYHSEDEDKPKFDKDYFKGSDPKTDYRKQAKREQAKAQQANGQQAAGQAGGDSRQQEGAQRRQAAADGQQQQETTARRTTMSSGVTIIDEGYETRRNRKIFAKDEGEYVDYTVAR